MTPPLFRRSARSRGDRAVVFGTGIVLGMWVALLLRLAVEDDRSELRELADLRIRAAESWEQGWHEGLEQAERAAREDTEEEEAKPAE